MKTFDEISKSRKELEDKLTDLLNEFQKQNDMMGPYSTPTITFRLRHFERPMSGGLHSIVLDLSI